MNKQFILILLISMVTFAHCQDIKVISKENSGNTIINFKTTNGKQVPIFRPMGQIDFNAGTDQVFLKKVQEIGSAPLSLELNNGYYTFQLYDWGPTFKIDAQGGTQDWMIRPGSQKYWVASMSGILFGVMTTFAAINYSIFSDKSNLLYDEENAEMSQTLIGAGSVGLITSLITYFFIKPKAKLVKSY